MDFSITETEKSLRIQNQDIFKIKNDIATERINGLAH